MVYLPITWSNFICLVMKKALLLLSICFSPVLLANEYGTAENGITLSVASGYNGAKLGVQNHSIKDLSDFHNAYTTQPNFSTLKLHKTWSNSSEWKLYSTHLISSPLHIGSPDYASPTLSLNHGASGFSMKNRLSLSKRYSSALIITPAIALNMLSSNALSTVTGKTNFYPFPILGQDNNENIYSFNTGIDMNGLFSQNWGYSADLEFAYLANSSGMHAWKSEALVFYQWQRNSKLLFGYKYINGVDSEQRNIRLYPVIDFLWAW